MKSLKNIIYSIIVLFYFCQSVDAQDNTLYFMDRIPQTKYVNPAIMPACKWYIGFPGISNLQFKASNNGFTYNDLIHKGTGVRKDSLIIDINNLLDKIYDKNFFQADLNEEILSFGFLLKEDYYFNFFIANRTTARISYPKEMLDFIVKGNGNEYLGKTASFEGLGLDVMNYNEYGFGYSQQVLENLSVGATIKILQGVTNVYTEKADITITTDSVDWKIDNQSNTIINVSAPMTVGLDTAGYVDFNSIEFKSNDYVKDFVLNKNFGVSLDFGAVYKFSERITLSASITDIGFINWKTNPHNFKSNAGYQYLGFDLTDYDEEVGIDFESMYDSLFSLTNTKHSTDAYTTWLNPRVFLGGYYNFDDNFYFGALSQIRFFEKSVHPSLSLSANARFWKLWNASLSYSMMDRNYTNIGLGIAMRLTPFQLYLITDNVTCFFIPHKTTNVNLKFGINLTFGCKEATKMSTDTPSIESPSMK